MMTEAPTREEIEAKDARVKALRPGDKVTVTFDESGCVCGCTRSDGYIGTVVEDDGKRRKGTIRIADSNGNCLSEFESHIDALEVKA